MHKLAFTALFSLFCLVPALRAVDLSPAETAQLLARLQEHRAKYPSLTADFTEEKTTHLLNKPIVSQGTLTFLAPNKFRRELHGNSPSTTISNGQKIWIYYPIFNEVHVYTLGQRGFFDDIFEAITAGINFQHITELYRTTASREADGWHLVLTPKSGGVKHFLKELSVWVDDDFKIQKTVAVLPKGDEVVTTYHNQRPTPVSPALFDYVPPPGATLSQMGK